MLPNFLKKLGTIAKGVAYQVVPGGRTYADAQREEEERRRRALQQQQAAQAQAAQRQAAQVRNNPIKVAQPVQDRRPLTIAPPQAQPSLKIAVPTPQPKVQVQNNGPAIPTPKSAGPPPKPADKRSLFQKLQAQFSPGDKATFKDPGTGGERLTIAGTIGEKFEANSPQDIARRKQSGKPERYEEQVKKSWVRRNLTPKGAALNAAHLGQDIASVAPTAVTSLLEAGRRNAMNAKGGTVKELQSLSYEERKRVIAEALKDPKNGLPLVLKNNGVNLDDPSDENLTAAMAKLRSQNEKTTTYHPGSRLEKFVFGSDKNLESYQQRGEGINKAVPGIPAPVAGLGLIGLDFTPGGGAKEKVAKQLAKAATEKEVIEILSKQGIKDVAPTIIENLVRAKKSKAARKHLEDAISQDLDTALRSKNIAVGDEAVKIADETTAEATANQGIKTVEDTAQRSAPEEAVKVAGEPPTMEQLVRDTTPIVPTRPLAPETVSKMRILEQANTRVPRPEGTVRVYQATTPGPGGTDWVFNNMEDLKNFMGPETTDQHIFNIVDTPVNNLVPTANGKTVFKLGDPSLAQFTDAAKATDQQVKALGEVGDEVASIRRTSGASTLEDLHPEQKQFLDDYADMLKSMDSGVSGGQMIPDGEGGYKRISEHTPFYRKYYAENGRAPSKQAYTDEALRQFNTGTADQYAMDEYRNLSDQLNDPALRDLMQNPDKYKPTPVNDYAPGENINIAELPLNVRVEAQSGLPMRVPINADGQAGLQLADEIVPTPSPKQRGFIQSVKESPELAPETRKGVSGEYVPKTNEELMANTDTLLQDIDRANVDVYEALRKPAGKLNDQEVSNAIGLAKYYDELDNDFGYEQSSNILDQLAEHLTEAGRTVQASQLLERRSPQGLLYSARKTLNKAGVNIDEALDNELQAAVARIKATEPGTTARNFEIHQMNHLVQENIPSKAGDKAFGIWRSGLLTAPTTTIGNVLGNTSRAALEMSSSPLVSFFDRIFSIRTGERTRTSTLRGRLSGANQGREKMGKYLKTGFDERNVTNKFENPELTFGNGPLGKTAQGYTTAVRRWVGGQDMPFYYSALQNSLESVAQAEAKNNGLRGRAARDFVKAFKEEPPTALFERANQTALSQVFQEKTALGWLAGQIQRVPGGKIIVPFAQVPAAIATQILDWTPVGTLKEIVSQVRKGKFDQYAMSKALGDSTMGTVGFMGLGYALQSNGLMTLGYPKDPKEQALWQQEGKQPFSINIGGRWVSTNYLQPFGTILAMGGSVHEAQANGDSPLVAPFATAGQSMTNQSFLRGLSGALNAVQEPGRYAGNFVENLARSTVPNIVQRLSAATDDLQREVNGIGPAIAQGLPGFRQGLPEKVDVFGQPQPNTAGFWGTMFDATRSKPEQSGPLVDELRRLQDAGQGVMPSVLDKKQTFDGESVPLNDEQLHGLQIAIGNQVKDAWSAMMGDPTWATLNDEEKKRALSNLLDDVTAVEKRKFAAENQVGMYSPEYTGEQTHLTGKQEALATGGFDPANYLTGSVRIAPNVSGASREIITKVDAMPPGAKKKFLAEGDNQYQYNLANFENDSANNELTAVDRYEKLLDLGKEKVKSGYSAEARELYGLSKKELAQYTAATPVSQDVLNEVYAMDNELWAKGFISSEKFDMGSGGGGGGGGGGKGKKPKELNIPLPKFGSFSLVKPPSSPTPDLNDVLADFTKRLGRIRVLDANLPPESSSNIQITV